MSGAEGGPGKRAGHKASTAPRSDPYSACRSSQRPVAAGGSLIREVPGRAASSPDEVRTVRNYQTGRAW